MNKTELVAAMAKETNLSKKDVEAVLKSFIDVVSEELKKMCIRDSFRSLLQGWKVFFYVFFK